MNKFSGIGKVNGDVSISYTQDGKPIARMSLAITNYKEDGTVAGSDFIPVTAFGKAAEVLEKAKKDDVVFIKDGSIQTGSYTDRNGQKVYTTDVIARIVQIINDDVTFNAVALMGRLTRDPYITSGETPTARFTLAVDRQYKSSEQDNADFISCVVFGKTAEFAEKYLRKGTKIALEGYFHTGSYTNKEGQKVYTKDIVGNRLEFAESKSTSTAGNGADAPANVGMSGAAPAGIDFGFINIPEGIDDELPFA